MKTEDRLHSLRSTIAVTLKALRNQETELDRLGVVIDNLQEERDLLQQLAKERQDTLEQAERHVESLTVRLNRPVNLPEPTVEEVARMTCYGQDYHDGWVAATEWARAEVRKAGFRINEAAPER